MHILTLKTSLIEKDGRGFVYWGKMRVSKGRNL